MNESVGTLTVLVASVISVGAICFNALALGGGTWIEDVENDGDFFARASYSFEDSAFFSSGQLISMGMWRYFTAPGVSNPLPFRDPELKAGTAAYVASLLFGSLSIVLLSYQILGIRRTCVGFCLTIFWTFFFQSALILVGNLVVLYYFRKTFEYESLGHTHHEGWVAFSLSLVNVSIAILRLYFAVSTRTNRVPRPRGEERGQSGSSRVKSPLASNTSENSGSLYRVVDLDIVGDKNPRVLKRYDSYQR